MSGGSTVFTSIAGFGLRRLARTLQESLGNKGEFTQSRHYRDPAHQSALSANSHLFTSQILHGVITDTTALGHCYRVQLENSAGVVICMCGGLSSFSSAGARDLTTLQTGTRVLVAVHPQIIYGIIICTLPWPAIDGKLQLHSVLNHATRNRTDEAHKQPYKQGGRGFAASWTAGRHFDATTIGEKGWITETGTRIFLDPFMAQLAVDEACGVFAFYHDQLLRIAGYNLRMFTAGMEREGIDDQEEYNDWTGYTPYPWEQMGLFERSDPRQQKEPREWQIDEPHYGVWEPLVDNQAPWHREREFHGYLGQGGKRNVCAPPKTPPEYFEFLRDDVQFPGLADDFTGLEGMRVISSAKGISIVKTLGIQSPARRYVPEQTEQSNEGDSPDNYKHAGIIGGGPDHEIKGNIETQRGNPELTRASGVLDLHAYWSNYGTFHPFFYHEKDWKVVSEEELEHLENASMEVPAYTELESQTFLSSAKTIQLDVDHRYGQVKYWKNQCGIELLEDGGVCIYDGWGSELRMTAGSVWLSAAGDAWINPGRNVNIWGGDDVNIRAKNSVDIIASNKDMRLKAERNQHFLSGNGDEGGTLIECRAPDKFEFEGKIGEDVVSGGVFLRSEKGTVGGWAKNIYWRVGGGDIDPGIICLDADKGNAPIVMLSDVQQHYVNTGVFWHLNSQGEIVAPAPTASLTDSGTTWPGSMCVGGGAIFGGAMVVDGSVASTQAYAAVEAPFVGELTGEPLEKIRELIYDCRERIDYTLPETGQNFYFDIVEPEFHEDMKPGDDTVIENAEFSLRNEDQYGSNDFTLYEMRWQKMGRLASTVTNTWQENPVEARSDPQTYPYPGKTHYQGSGSYYESDLEIFEITGTDGKAKSHGSQPNLADAYKNPKYAQPNPGNLNDYKVIIP